MGFEVIAEHLELGRRRQPGPVDDRDHRRRVTAPLPEGAQHGGQLALAGFHEPAREPAAEGAHHRQPGENLGQVVAVGHAGRRLRVVLHVTNSVGEKAVQPRRRRGGAAAGVGQRQPLLFGIQVKLGAQALVLEQRALECLQRAVHGLRGAHGLLVAALAQDLGAERNRERALAERQAARGLALAQSFQGRGCQAVVREQLVVGGDRVLHFVGMWFHQRCSPRQGALPSPRA